jgi:RNA:NAD 2'-phosphotransferase (TPT1/KptA family)
MKITPESMDRKRRILVSAAIIALGRAAYIKTKTTEDKIYHASFWLGSESVFADIIDDAQKISYRLAAPVIRNNEGEVVDVKVSPEDDEPPPGVLDEMEQEFVDKGLE